MEVYIVKSEVLLVELILFLAVSHGHRISR